MIYRIEKPETTVKKDGTKFKVGRAHDVWERVNRIVHIEDVDLENSYVLSGEKNISRLEKTLHYMLDCWADPEAEKQDGYTEWFDRSCYKQAIDVIHYIMDLRKHQSMILTKGIKPNDSWVKYQLSLARRAQEFELAIKKQKLRIVQMMRYIRLYSMHFMAYSEDGYSYHLVLKNHGDIAGKLAERVMSRSKIFLPNYVMNLVSLLSDNEYIILTIFANGDFLKGGSLESLEPQLSDLKTAFAEVIARLPKVDWVQERAYSIMGNVITGLSKAF
jgi:hypothetical protein